MFKNVFGSGFSVRTAHVVSTWIITSISFSYDTELRRQEETGQSSQPVSFVSSVSVSVSSYFAVSLMDPGFISTEDSDSQFTSGLAEEQQDMIPPSTKSSRQRRCGHCSSQQPMRSKHCQTCQHCVRRYDHHCPWIENCVGEKNHRWFVLYSAVQSSVSLWASRITWTGSGHAPSWSPWSRSNGVSSAVSASMASSASVVSSSSGSHLYSVSMNITTWEFMSRHRISYLKHCGADQNPFDRGAAQNSWGFFCEWGGVAWEQVYFREDDDDPV